MNLLEYSEGEGIREQMLKNLLKRREKIPVLNEVFGEVEYGVASWVATENARITLWEKAYELEVCAVAKDKNESISLKQEKSYEDFKMTICEKQKQMEEIIENYYNTKDPEVLISKFTPTELMFGRKGECVIMADNADDDDTQDVPLGLAVCFVPHLKLYTQEDCLGYILSKSGIPEDDYLWTM